MFLCKKKREKDYALGAIKLRHNHYFKEVIASEGSGALCNYFVYDPFLLFLLHSII